MTKKESKTGRPSLKEDPKVVEEILNLLRSGCVVQDVAAKIGISRTTFFQWQATDPDFADKVARARSEARIGAATVIRRAMAPFDETSQTVRTFTETRLRRGPRGQQVPYDYTRREVIDNVIHHLGDWHAALEYLKRQDPENWSEHLVIKFSASQAERWDALGLGDPLEALIKVMERAEILKAERERLEREKANALPATYAQN